MTRDASSHPTTGTRRLTAIMSADIAGYSRLMGHDEEGTHARLTRYRREIVEPTIAEHNGTVVKHMGDGFLATFDSPLEATRCAIVIQQTIAARNAAVADKNHWLQYRIGINLGDIILEANDVFGDGVNVAARLQTAAKPGDVNISGGVYEQIKNKLVCGYQSLGDERLKNITDPVRIYRVLPDPSAVSRADRGVKRIARIVLPVAAACTLTFGIGVWYATRNTADTRADAGTVSSSSESSVSGRSPNPPSMEFLEAKASPPPIPALPAPNPQTSPVPPAQPTQVAVVAPSVPVQQIRPEPQTSGARDCANCPEMVRVAGGTFRMGNASEPTESPPHEVVVTPFAISRIPVTRSQWQACVDSGECNYEPSGAEDISVRNVSWDDAQKYVAWLSKISSRKYRLPTEIEWEYAARAGSVTAYWWGPEIHRGYANCKACGTPHDPEKPIQIGLLPPNPFGLQGMGGGVAEWVSDCWHSSYRGAPRTGSWNTSNCREHVLRGGSWLSDPDDIKVTSREHYDTSVRYPTHGFRVVFSER